MKNIGKTGWFLFCLVMLLSLASNAQETSGSLSGKIKDTTGKVVAGASITALHTASGTKYSVATDEKGFYFLNNMRIGNGYTITVSMVGMQTETREHVDIRLGGSQQLDFILTPGSQQLSAVTVSARGRKLSQRADTYGACLLYTSPSPRDS